MAGLALGLGSAAFGGEAPLRYAVQTAQGVKLHVIHVDLNHPQVVVSPALAAGGVGRSEPFSSFVRRLQPVAAINGTYFGKRTLRPIGDIVVDGRLAYFGGMGTGIAFARDGVDFIRLPKSRRVDWSEHRAALAGGPLLVWDGFAKEAPGGEGFGDPHVFSRAARRTAVGVTADNHLLLVTTVTGTSLPLLAKAMRALGAVYAINLDGGSSSAMWYRGRTIRAPGGRLTNVLSVYVKPDPVRDHELRPPRGLDWRAGHRKRQVISFRAQGVNVSVELPRRWPKERDIRLTSDKPLPPETSVSVHVNDRSVAILGALPAELDVPIEDESRPKHKLWVGLVDREGKTLGGVHRILVMP